MTENMAHALQHLSNFMSTTNIIKHTNS